MQKTTETHKMAVKNEDLNFTIWMNSSFSCPLTERVVVVFD